MKKLYYTITLLAALLAWGCSETLEETYDEYTEGGMIRYIGKCSNLEVNPGWERLQVIWKNNIDAGIKRVKVTWQSENENTPNVRYIERPDTIDTENLMDTVYLENLQDALYKVRVSNLSADSTESLVEERDARPYFRFQPHGRQVGDRPRPEQRECQAAGTLLLRGRQERLEHLERESAHGRHVIL